MRLKHCNKTILLCSKVFSCIVFPYNTGKKVIVEVCLHFFFGRFHNLVKENFFCITAYRWFCTPSLRWPIVFTGGGCVSERFTVVCDSVCAHIDIPIDQGLNHFLADCARKRNAAVGCALKRSTVVDCFREDFATVSWLCFPTLCCCRLRTQALHTREPFYFLFPFINSSFIGASISFLSHVRNALMNLSYKFKMLVFLIKKYISVPYN